MSSNVDLATAVLLVTVAALSYAAFIDLKHYKISNELILILMGARRDVRLVDLLLFGSAVLDVARKSPVPVLLVPIHEGEKTGAV